MSATEELRELLDERGVEYYESPNGVAWGKLTTPIHGQMYTHYAVELDGLLCVDSHCITPEQTIAATLGSEREKELESLAADMFCWLVDYLTPQQVRTWENRLEDLDVPPTWGVRS